MGKGTAGWFARSLVVALSLMLASACASPITIGPAATEVAAIVTAEVETVTPEEATPTDVPPTPTVLATPTAPPSAQCTVRNVRGLRMRAGPGTTFDVVTTLTASEVLTGNGRNADSTWVAVTSGSGAQGWVAADFVDCGDGLAGLPEAQSTQTTP